jgi:16S rRNA (adenine1518-N6/adenine1519-N6)-dimethyltransferase
MAFDKSKHLIRVQGGREYLPVSARLVWFREEHPDWSIVTNPVEINLEKQYAIFSATIMNPEGRIMATATKMENVRGFGDYMEKAETGAVGRALAYCGYGTQFAPELEEGTRLADAPFAPGGARGGNRFGGGAPQGGGASRPNGFAAGNNRPPMPAAPTRLGPAPAEPDFGDEPEEDEAPTPPPAARPAAARPPMNAAAAPAARPAPPPVTNDEDEDDEDPFADGDDAPAAPARPAAPVPARAATPRQAAASAVNENGDAVLSTNKCSEDGCPMTLTPSQVNMSMTKFGRALCPRHQKDATPVAGGGGAAAPARRGGATAKPEMNDSLLSANQNERTVGDEMRPRPFSRFMDLTKPSELSRLLKSHGLHLSKRFGQNFLVDRTHLLRVVESADLQPDDRVFEIGPGVGTLTVELAVRAARVASVELDRGLLPILAEVLAPFPNAHVIHADALKLDLSAVLAEHLGEPPYKVAANIPYNITSPLLGKLLDDKRLFASVTLMVQKEVARRLVAAPASDDYSALSVFTQFHAEPSLVSVVPRGAFFPPPKVDSAVVHLVPRPAPPYDVPSEEAFLSVSRAVFGQRRKTLANALSGAPALTFDRDTIQSALATTGIDGGRRGETLSGDEIAALSRALFAPAADG